jgi:hypothetical protein
VLFLINNGLIGFVILGSVFLAVTGAEALYADMGHFGRGPIRTAWLALVLPCLTLNYLGQGGYALANLGQVENLFWRTIPDVAYWPIMALATLAAVIASQAVITGAFSLTQQAVQLGILPRLQIKRTSETQAGQIFVPVINMLLMIGVLALLATFRTSSNLTAAYGIAVTGTMFVDTLLFFVILRYFWKRPLWQCAIPVAVFGFIDLVFLGSNMLKIPQGAWMPLAMGGALVLLILTWQRGTVHPGGEDAQGRHPARGPHGDAEGEAAAARARHGHLPDLRPHHRARGADAQPQAQQGAARAQRDPDGDHGRDPARARKRAGGDRADQRGLPPGDGELRLHGDAQRPQGAGGLPQAGAEVRHHGDVLLPGPALGGGLRHLGHAAVAGQDLHLPAAQRRQPDGLLPHPARPGGGAGGPGHRLRPIAAAPPRGDAAKGLNGGG